MELDYIDTVVSDFVVPRLAALGITEKEFYQKVDRYDGDWGEALDSFKGTGAISADLDVIVGTHTPFLAAIESWKGLADLKLRNLNQYVRDLTEFATTSRGLNTRTVQGITKREVQKWADEQAPSVPM